MPNSGPVYQPTTVSYEQQREWPSPTGFLSQTTSNSTYTRWLQWFALGLSLIGIAAGLVMMIEGSIDYMDTNEFEVGRNLTQEEKESEEAEMKVDVVIVVIGVLLLVVGLTFLGFYLRLSGRRKNCPCLWGKDQRMVRQLRGQQQGVNGHTMNPSTDLLVTAQYAPVSEIAYQPPQVSEEEETRKLMGSDLKDSILKESNSVITLNPERFEPEESPMPRRLARYTTAPISDAPQTPQPRRRDAVQPSLRRASSWKSNIQRKASTRSKRLAPLAGHDEITPSLRSSWNSMCLNDDSTDSETDRTSRRSDSV